MKKKEKHFEFFDLYQNSLCCLGYGKLKNLKMLSQITLWFSYDKGNLWEKLFQELCLKISRKNQFIKLQNDIEQ